LPALAVPIMRAPTCLPMSMAARPTPPPALWISTVSSFDNEPTTTISCHAVTKFTGMAAACSNVSFAGFSNTCPCGTHTVSA